MSDGQSAGQTGAIIASTLVAFISGYMLGIYTIRGYLISPALVEERRRNLEDQVESEESDIDEDDTILDHAPNWANGEEADRRDGLRANSDTTSKPRAKTQATVKAPGGNEECKLVLVVRTDLGMTKGAFIYILPLAHVYLVC
jgi:peptidyl-tRNA hydrolase, PTH2 family